MTAATSIEALAAVVEALSDQVRRMGDTVDACRADVKTCRNEVGACKDRMGKVETLFNEEVKAELDGHQLRIEDHSVQIQELHAGQAQLRIDVGLMSAQVERASDAASVAALSTERMEQMLKKDIEVRHTQAIALQGTLDRILEYIQPKFELPAPSSGVQRPGFP